MVCTRLVARNSEQSLPEIAVRPAHYSAECCCLAKVLNSTPVIIIWRGSVPDDVTFSKGNRMFNEGRRVLYVWISTMADREHCLWWGIPSFWAQVLLLLDASTSVLAVHLLSSQCCGLHKCNWSLGLLGLVSFVVEDCTCWADKPALNLILHLIFIFLIIFTLTCFADLTQLHWVI